MSTFEYTCYLGRDRDDWSEGTIEASTLEMAIINAERKIYGTGYTLKRSSVKLIENK